MTNFGFKNRSTAVALKNSLRPGQATVDGGLSRATEGWILKTPAGGIPAAATDYSSAGSKRAGKATCTIYYIDEDDLILTFKDETGAVITKVVYNIASEAVAANVFIQAKTVFGKLVVDWEQCD